MKSYEQIEYSSSVQNVIWKYDSLHWKQASLKCCWQLLSQLRRVELYTVPIHGLRKYGKCIICARTVQRMVSALHFYLHSFMQCIFNLSLPYVIKQHVPLFTFLFKCHFPIQDREITLSYSYFLNCDHFVPDTSYVISKL